ncbi:hypothetical protein Q9L58_010151 [Maublancomyces gigas]|uniref:DUF6532 domain-containing protein n=1 Tax=Discina gigas TaxID=1032678 RepID=A0ABR3G591_9PEZI
MTSAEDLPPVPFASLPEPISPLPDFNASVPPAPPPPPPTPAASPIESDSSRSRNCGVESIVGPANSVVKDYAEFIKKYVLLKEPLSSATLFIAMVVELWNRANEEMILDVIMCNESKAQIKSYHLRARSHLLYLIKEKVDCKTLNLLRHYVGPTHSIQRIEYLLENDRCLSSPDHYTVCSCKFLAPEIVVVIYAKYFYVTKMLGNKDPEFLERINLTFVCLVTAGIWHGIRAWRTGTYIKPKDFTGSNERTFTRMMNTWRNRRPSVQEAVMDHIKQAIRERITLACGKIEVIPVQAFEEDEELLRKALQAFREVSNHPLVSTTGQGQLVTPEESNELIRAHVQDPDRDEMLDAVESNAELEEEVTVECRVEGEANSVGVSQRAFGKVVEAMRRM